MIERVGVVGLDVADVPDLDASTDSVIWSQLVTAILPKNTKFNIPNPNARTRGHHQTNFNAILTFIRTTLHIHLPRILTAESLFIGSPESVVALTQALDGMWRIIESGGDIEDLAELLGEGEDIEDELDDQVFPLQIQNTKTRRLPSFTMTRKTPTSSIAQQPNLGARTTAATTKTARRTSVAPIQIRATSSSLKTPQIPPKAVPVVSQRRSTRLSMVPTAVTAPASKTVPETNKTARRQSLIPQNKVTQPNTSARVASKGRQSLAPGIT